MALHLLYNPLRLIPLIDTCQEGDAIILFDQALQQWPDLHSASAPPLTSAVYALRDECRQQNLNVAHEGVMEISFADWVELATQHAQQVSWV